MDHSLGWQTRRVLALLWSFATIGFLLFVSVLILGDRRFPLNLGLINTTGRAGLWATLLPGLLGLLAAALVLRRSTFGAWLLAAYSLFWSSIFLLTLPIVWNAKSTFCTPTFCITTAWVSRSLVLGLAAPFALVAIWARHNASVR